MVYFKNYDLDDPSTDVAPIDNNGIQGNDNRGEANTPASAGTLLPIGACISDQSGIRCPTDANGVATIEFWTTMQPGDNFAVAASLDSNYLNGISTNGIELADSTGNTLPQTTFVPPARAKRTEMLTVWRKLHIEVDRMENVPVNTAANGNRVTGSFRFGGFLNPGTFAVPIVVPPDLDVGRFVRGRIEFNNLSLPVARNGLDSVEITRFC